MTDQIFPKEDMDHIQKMQENSPKKGKWKKEILAFGASALIIFAVLAGIVAWPAIIKNIQFDEDKHENVAQVEGEVEKPFECPEASDSSSICIPKIETEAPVILEGGTEYKKDIFEDLKSGVVHAEGTALPGQAGNSFIIGHSNDYPWRDGDYKTIFALLNKLEKDDIVFLYHDGERHRYDVYEKLVVAPRDTWVMDQNEDESIVSVMTCWPPATTLRRLVVRAKLQAESPNVQEADATDEPIAE